MPTHTFLCGAECGIISSGAAPAGSASHWFATSGTGTCVATTANVHPGGSLRSYKFTTSASVFMLQTQAVGTATTTITRFYVYFDVLPSSGQVAILTCEGANESSFGYDSATGQFATKIQGNSWVSGGPTVVTGKWYRIDTKHTCGSNPNTIDWQVDGAAQVQNSAAFGASTWNELRIGAGTNGGSTTATLYIDDLAVSKTTGDYPLGDGRIIGYSPNADGTHNFTDGDFVDGGGLNPPSHTSTTLYQSVDEVPLTSIADSWHQTITNGADYIEIKFTPSGETLAPRGVEVVSVHHSLTTPVGSQICSAKLFEGGTEVSYLTVGNLPDASGLVQCRGMFTVAPSLNPWTVARLNATTFRFGYGSDATGSPGVDGVILEVEFPPGIIIQDSGAKSQYYNALVRM